MSSINNNREFFQFIAKQANGDLRAADTNGNGHIERNELKDFLDSLNFDYSILEDFNGGNKDDLFNQFFNSINNVNDSNDRIVVDGKKKTIREKNSLNEKEITNAENRIIAYNYLEEYRTTALVDLPSWVDQQKVGSAIMDKLEALVENYISKGKLDNVKKENVEDVIGAFLYNNTKEIKNKAVAEAYSSDFSAELLRDYVKNYDYKIGDDKTLKDIIENCVKNIDGTTTFNEIKENVEKAITEYAATVETTGQTGEKALLNDLQKAVAMKKLTEVLLGVVKYNTTAPYDDFTKADYEEEIQNFLKAQLSGSVDFQALMTTDIILDTFKEKELKTIETKIQVKNAFKNDSIKNMIKQDEVLGEQGMNIMATIENLMPGEVRAFDNLKNEIAGLVKKGEFLMSDGTLDTDTLGNWIISKLKSILADFYGEMSSDMSIDDLKNVYKAEKENGENNNDSKAIKDAAKKLLKALCEKAEQYKAAIEDQFGADYAAKIDKMYAYKVEEEIEKLITKIDSIAKTIRTDVNVPDKTSDVKAALDNFGVLTKPEALSFYVNDKGEVKFVTMGTQAHGVFNKNNSTTTNTVNYAMEDLKETLEETYKEQLEKLGLYKDDNATKDGNTLFNAALFLALSDPTIVTSQYEKITDITKLVDAVISNYTKLLKNVGKDENALKYIQNYTSNSILAGRTPAPQDGYNFAGVKAGGYEWDSAGVYYTKPYGFDSQFKYDSDGYYYYYGNKSFGDRFKVENGVYYRETYSYKAERYVYIDSREDAQKGILRYYQDDTTHGNDDWIRPSTITTSKAAHKHNGQTISILEYTTSITSEKGDTDMLNKAMRTLADDYVDKYGSMIDASRLCELFVQAQEEAMSKISQITSQTEATGSNVYGYGEVGSTTTYDPLDNFDTAKNSDDGMLVNIGNVILQVMFEMERLIGLEMMK